MAGVFLTTKERWQWADRLERIGFQIQAKVHKMISSGEDGLCVPVAYQAGDTIYALDRRVEELLEQEIESWPLECFPLVLVSEGNGVDGCRIFGGTGGTPKYRLLVDPIDGTRGLMYDKRSGWFLAAVAIDAGEGTRLSSVFASVMVELPTSKQTLCDSYAAVRHEGLCAKRTLIGGGKSVSMKPRPSHSTTLGGGFGSIVSFFQGTKVLSAELLERIADLAIEPGDTSESAILDDQYISTGGQLVELVNGHDRFCCDLRPLMFRMVKKLGRATGPPLFCHPYDLAGLLVAEEAGVVIRNGFGEPLDAVFGVDEPMHWCGYANQNLQNLVAPIVETWVRARLG